MVELHNVDKNREPEDPINNRRYRREVGDIYLDDVGPPVLGREFFEVDRRRHTNRQGQYQHHDHHVKRAEDRDA